MCKKHATKELIYGANGSGKSQMVRERMNKKGSYLFSFNDCFSKEFINQEAAENMFNMLTKKELKDIVSLSFSEKLIAMFCYELEAILEMEQPYTRLFIDGFPFEMDIKTLDNFFSLFDYLNSLGFKVVVTTCKKSIRDRCHELYDDDPNFKFVEL